MGEDRSRRFARLRGTPSSQGTLDLFEHFGVPSDPGSLSGGEDRARARGQPCPALPCPQCGWFRATPWVEPCLICAAPGRSSAGGGG